MKRQKQNFPEASITLDAHKQEEPNAEENDRPLEPTEESKEIAEEKCNNMPAQAIELGSAIQIGRIDLSFPESSAKFSNSDHCYPPSYYTLSYKERLLLLYAENFRCQFVANNSQRRPLVLALPNECNVQKFVCTTIRPTAFTYTPLIRNAEECASFVADFISYEPLEDMLGFPNKLRSPDSLLRERRGNIFEMATLLCSMLIGAGYPAVVVSGVARADVVANNQRNVPYPHEILEVCVDDIQKEPVKTKQRYKLRPIPDLSSHLEENIQELLRQKQAEEQKTKDELQKAQQEELERKVCDKNLYRRSHAWVAIIENAPWSIKPKKTQVNENGYEIEEPPCAVFIEPSTGLFCPSNSKSYVLVDSVWNNSQYYVNKQKYEQVAGIRWDLTSPEDWEYLLPGELMAKRKQTDSEDNMLSTKSVVAEEKHLDIVRSWVSRLHIGEKEFEERFPQLQKTVLYQVVKCKRFSPYSQKDGKVKQLTLYAVDDHDYKKPTFRWEYYENRSDLLLQLKFVYETAIIEETFAKGRNDSLKFLRTNLNFHLPKELFFYAASRQDDLKYLKYEQERITLQYAERRGSCLQRIFEFKSSDQTLHKIMENFSRDLLKPADNDIFVRSFLLTAKKISLKYHYAPGALTASTREFTKPPKPDYGQEVIFDDSLVKSYQANPSTPKPTRLELYRLLLHQMREEDKLKRQFEKVLEEINAILDQRKNELENPLLKFRLFDNLRNKGARAKRLQKYADDAEYQRELKSKPADFLAPYLVPYGQRKLTCEESWAVYNACLLDLKSRFVNILNNLQRNYEDLTTESKSLERFLNKFENQFNNHDYEQLVDAAKEIGLNKRMVQQRLTLTHQGSQQKYETVKEYLLNDPRLNLPKKQNFVH